MHDAGRDSTIKYLRRVRTALLAKESVLDPLRRSTEHFFKGLILFKPETPGKASHGDGSSCLHFFCEY